jgi:hypothetical protein
VAADLVVGRPGKGGSSTGGRPATPLLLIGAGLLILLVVLGGVVVLRIGTAPKPGPVGTPTRAPASGHCSGPIRLISDQFPIDATQTGGATVPTFNTKDVEGGGKRFCLAHLATYHWNGGKGAPVAGTITIADSRGKVLGTWKATATPATNNVLATWEAAIPVKPPLVLDGIYMVKDSGPETWSWSKASGGKGFIRVWAEDYVP